MSSEPLETATPMTRAEEHLFAAFERERLVEDRTDSAGQRRDILDPARVVAHDCELVAAEARELVAAAQHALDALRDDCQELVAGRVTEAVVHDLEVVDVEQDQADAVFDIDLRRARPASHSTSITRFGSSVSGSCRVRCASCASMWRCSVTSYAAPTRCRHCPSGSTIGVTSTVSTATRAVPPQSASNADRPQLRARHRANARTCDTSACAGSTERRSPVASSAPPAARGTRRWRTRTGTRRRRRPSTTNAGCGRRSSSAVSERSIRRGSGIARPAGASRPRRSRPCCACASVPLRLAFLAQSILGRRGGDLNGPPVGFRDGRIADARPVTCAHDLPGVRRAGARRRTVLPGMRAAPGPRPRRAAPGHRVDGRPRGLHRVLGRHRPRAGQTPGRRQLRARSSATSPRSAAASTRSSATRSSPSSARRSRTRTTPNARCARRCACRRRSPISARNSGVAVQMRVGVNTGEVLVGAMRAGGDPTVMGDVVNTAQRLEKLAAPGEVDRRSGHLRRDPRRDPLRGARAAGPAGPRGTGRRVSGRSRRSRRPGRRRVRDRTPLDRPRRRDRRAAAHGRDSR